MNSANPSLRFLPSQILALVGWVLLCFAAASLGGLFMPGEWYASLKKPTWHPPAWIFGPVWTALYTAMAVAAWLVWRRGGWAAQRRPLLLFLAQLALNAVWTPLFFGLHRTGLAVAESRLTSRHCIPSRKDRRRAHAKGRLERQNQIERG